MNDSADTSTTMLHDHALTLLTVSINNRPHTLDTGRCCAMETVEKTKVMRISRQPSPLKIMINQKTGEACEIFKLRSIITNGARCTRAFTFRIARQKQKKFLKQNGLQFKEETSKVLNTKHSFV